MASSEQTKSGSTYRNLTPIRCAGGGGGGGRVGGYECKFVDEPPDELVCQICTLVAMHPYQTSCCGRVFCRLCVEGCKKQSEKTSGGGGRIQCPNCRKRTHVFYDKRGSRNIKCLKVKCSYESFGCRWKGQLMYFEGHMSCCDHCREVCPNGCSETVARGNMTKHLEGECVLRKYKCPDCQKNGSYKYVALEHQPKCPEATVPCPNGCGFAPITRRLLTSHQTVCPNEIVSCDYYEIGCYDDIKRKDILLHRTQRLEQHLDLAMRAIRKLRQPLAVFKMRDYSHFKCSKKWWYSPGFHTHSKGYRLCLGVSAYGNGDGAGTHVSVYVYRMKGDNDENLIWPFRGQVTFELLNQLQDSSHVLRTIPFDFHAMNEYNSRVVKGDRSGQGWGYNRFFLHEDMKANQCSTAIYLKEDCLFFRVTNIEVFSSNKPWLTCSS